MSITLSKFIQNLEEVKNEGLCKIAEKEIKDIFYVVLYEMAKRTITDTGQSRSSIIDDFASKYGYNVSALYSEFYGFWEKRHYPENANRDWGNANVAYTDKFDGKQAKVKLKINDEGLYAQEHADAQGLYNGHLYPSEIHSGGIRNKAGEIVVEGTGRDNSRFIPHHITYVSDNWQYNMEVENLFNQITNKIAERLFKK
jgi:hypothetical protein